MFFWWCTCCAHKNFFSPGTFGANGYNLYYFSNFCFCRNHAIAIGTEFCCVAVAISLEQCAVRGDHLRTASQSASQHDSAAGFTLISFAQFPPSASPNERQKIIERFSRIKVEESSRKFIITLRDSSLPMSWLLLSFGGDHYVEHARWELKKKNN